ncbi:WhiB family transcriptional regulator [Pseudactinotalea sp. Z1748]|uniref:WhiB family transcriptional regulator n=1 Tax=Pseudactinotalea sp. Z1748 TaxID=3413027 RepID=UPI003C79C661
MSRRKQYQGRYPTTSMVKDNWADYGSCTPQNAGEDWDPSLHYDTARIKNAKTVCATCPVIAQCLGFARTNDTSEGVWGGESFWPRSPGRPASAEARQAAA